MNRTPRDDEYFICPHCGAEVAVGASSCRECGASDESGWQDEDGTSHEDDAAGYSADDDFDYDEFISQEFPEHRGDTLQLDSRRLVAGFVAAVLILGIVASIYYGLRQ